MALHVQRLQIVAINLSHAIKPNILVGVAEYPKLAFLIIIQMCSISLQFTYGLKIWRQDFGFDGRSCL